VGEGQEDRGALKNRGSKAESQWTERLGPRDTMWPFNKPREKGEVPDENSSIEEGDTATRQTRETGVPVKGERRKSKRAKEKTKTQGRPGAARLPHSPEKKQASPLTGRRMSRKLNLIPANRGGKRQKSTSTLQLTTALTGRPRAGCRTRASHET